MRKVLHSWDAREWMISRIIKEMGLSGKEDFFLKEGMKVFHKYNENLCGEIMNDYLLHNAIRNHFRTFLTVKEK
ncbi:hypothetical protein [Halobacillus sp. Marseille-Q1614]|uniref:hypothetical protein n=1 Tax=Halobacillus sp. Marseille-Q1614 TaxID=2709134 RepID=UPI0015708FC7|nr:hypothetical protein [Halobacillus sp. Marseille-Q1614]